MEKNQISGLLIAAKVLMIISTVLSGIILIPLAWTIPMTVTYCKKLNRGEKVGTGFKICSLFFVSAIGGLLMLCDTSQMEKAPQIPPETNKN